MGSKSSKQAREHDRSDRPTRSRMVLQRGHARHHQDDRGGMVISQPRAPLDSGNNAPRGTNMTLGSLRYRPLDRAKGEIRLLRILPPAPSAYVPDGFGFDPSIVRCQLEYESIEHIEAVNMEATRDQLGRDLVLDILFNDLPDLESADGDRFAASLKEGMRSELRKRDVDENRRFDMHFRRKQRLQELFAASSERRKTSLPAGFESYTSLHTWESWQETWIWHPLSGNETHPQTDSAAYLALSYVWSDAPSLADTDEHARDIFMMYLAGGVSYEKAIKDANLEAFTENRPQSGRGQIVVDGILVEVGRNLEKALRALREIPEVQSGRRVWVDYLCINQHDLAERQQEVKRMGDIYGRAERIVSWLGDEEDCSDQALEFMNLIGQSIMTEMECDELAEWFYHNIRSEIGLHVAQLLCRSYWSRIWIMQEVILGNDNAITICGPRRIPTSKLLTFGVRMSSFGAQRSTLLRFNDSFDLSKDHTGSRKPVSAMALSKGIGKLRDLRQLQVNLDANTSHSTPTSTFWFRTASANFATDPRDKVYGMLTVLPKSLVSALPVDYSEKCTYRDVMVNFAVANFHSTQSLMWLLHRPWSPFPGWQDWPSWVPNLGLKFSLAHFNWVVGSNCNDGVENVVHFAAWTEGSNYDWPLLAVEALFIDSISETTLSQAAERRAQHAQFVAAPWLADEVAGLAGIPSDTFRRTNRQGVALCFPEPPPLLGLRLQEARQHRYGDLYGLRQGLAQCFERMGFRMRRDDETIFDIPLDFLEHGVQDLDGMALLTSPTFEMSAYHILKGIMTTFGSLDLWGLHFRDLFASNDDITNDTFNSSVPQMTLGDRTPCLARLFRTCSGYVGAALGELQAGDQIFVIRGCPMPVALRPGARAEKPGAYQVVGGVFVPGIMHGEAWSVLDGNGDRPRLEGILLI